MPKANVLVVPEQWETIPPNALTEGTVLGKAMVASRIGGILFSEGRLCQQLLGLYHSLIPAENGERA